MQIGNDEIKEIYVGSDQIKEVYYGSEKVWGEIESIQDGYWVHKDTGVKTYFGIEEPSIEDGIMSKPSWSLNCSEVQLPTGVTELGSRCFSASTLTSINIPEGVTSLGVRCFWNCSSLTLAALLPSIPPSLGFAAFDGVHTSFNIKVRSPYVDDYKTATNWIDYAAIISAI